MVRTLQILLLMAFLQACKSKQEIIDLPNGEVENPMLKVALGSCNRQDLSNVFWDDILAVGPDVFIWGGDNIYADTDDMSAMQEMYVAQKNVPAYAALRQAALVTGTWDDHDYGLNDGGAEFQMKKQSQQLFLDFLEVPEHDPRRNREGVYSSQLISKPAGTVKIINLDTRYFRTPLTKSNKKDIRYQPNAYGEGTILGEKQWEWLSNELSTSRADFNLIMTSIQFLSNEHGFEKWGNFPHEVDRMKEILGKSGARGVIFLSGDRHISEFSKTDINGLSCPLIDFTSSGLTHSYSSYEWEPNPYRMGEVISVTSFGLLEINLETKEVVFKIMGDNGSVLAVLKQTY